MAAHPIVVVGDGVVEIPEELLDDPRFQKGARLELVPVGTTSASDRPVGDWRRLRGMFKDSSIDLNTELDKDRLAETALDERMIGGNVR